MLDRLARDAAQRHVSEQALRESEARFRSLIDNAPAGIHLKDLDGRYLIVNDEFAKYAKAKAEDMVGKTNDDFFPPEVTARSNDSARRVLETGARQTYDVTFSELDGTVRQALTTKFGVRDDGGDI